MVAVGKIEKPKPVLPISEVYDVSEMSPVAPVEEGSPVTQVSRVKNAEAIREVSAVEEVSIPEELPELMEKLDLSSIGAIIRTICSFQPLDHSSPREDEDESLFLLQRLYAGTQSGYMGVLHNVSSFRLNLLKIAPMVITKPSETVKRYLLLSPDQQESKESDGNQVQKPEKEVSLLWNSFDQRKRKLLLDNFSLIFDPEYAPSALARWLIGRAQTSEENGSLVQSQPKFEEKSLPPALALLWNKFGARRDWDATQFLQLWCCWLMRGTFQAKYLLKETGFLEVCRERAQAGEELPADLTTLTAEDIALLVSKAQEENKRPPILINELMKMVIAKRTIWLKPKRLWDDLETVRNEGGFCWRASNPSAAKFLENLCEKLGINVEDWFRRVIPKNDQELSETLNYIKALIGINDPSSRVAAEVIQKKRQDSMSSPKLFMEHLLWELKLLIVWEALISMYVYEAESNLKKDD